LNEPQEIETVLGACGKMIQWFRGLSGSGTVLVGVFCTQMPPEANLSCISQGMKEPNEVI